MLSWSGPSRPQRPGALAVMMGVSPHPGAVTDIWAYFHLVYELSAKFVPSLPSIPRLSVMSVKPGEKPLVPASGERRARPVLCIIRDNFIQNLYKVYGNQIKYQNIKILTTTNKQCAGPDIRGINTGRLVRVASGHLIGASWSQPPVSCPAIV